MLVAAVLGPEKGEDRELEVIRLALEQVDDARVLTVREPESPVSQGLVNGDVVERLSGDSRQVSQCNREGRRRPSRWNEE